jgi:hypothetical protein
MRFYIGLHQPSDAHHFDRACISVVRLQRRKKTLGCPEILLDSGAFSELALHGRYRHSVGHYADIIRRLEGVGTIVAAVAQDYMCEPFMLAKTGGTVADHQRLTIERYRDLRAENLPVPIMPVLQGYAPADYAKHLSDYGDDLTPGMWVGVGSVCKRNGNPERIVEVISAIKAVRPDLRLHGFGVKQTALAHGGVMEMLYSADSLAWSYAARKQGRNPHCWREAEAYQARVSALPHRPWQMVLGI